VPLGYYGVAGATVAKFPVIGGVRWAVLGGLAKVGDGGSIVVLGRTRGRLPRRAWRRYSAGEGANGHRYYDWAWVAIDPGEPGHRWLLIRRNRHTGELAFYRCHSPGTSRCPSWSRSPGPAGPRRRISRPARD
jgi:hypothetical protein